MYDNILVPVTLADEKPEAHLSLVAAERLANTDASITILHVQEPVPGFVAAELPAELLDNNRKDVMGRLENLANGISDAKTALIEGTPGRAILDYASEHKVDCIILESHKPGLQNLFLGSTANKIVHHARCSVHVIR